VCPLPFSPLPTNHERCSPRPCLRHLCCSESLMIEAEALRLNVLAKAVHDFAGSFSQIELDTMYGARRDGVNGEHHAN
jgi:hypothetical protein